MRQKSKVCSKGYMDIVAEEGEKQLTEDKSMVEGKELSVEVEMQESK